jgi:hypothetical protein
MIVLHNAELTKVFQGEIAAHREKIQERPLIAK